MNTVTIVSIVLAAAWLGWMILNVYAVAAYEPSAPKDFDRTEVMIDIYRTCYVEEKITLEQYERAVARILERES